MAPSPTRRRHVVQSKSPKAGRSRIVQAKALTQQLSHQVRDDEAEPAQRMPPPTFSMTRKPPSSSKGPPSAFRYGFPHSSSSSSSKPLPPDPFQSMEESPRPESPTDTTTSTHKNHNFRFHRRPGSDSVAQKIPIEQHLRAMDKLSKGGGAIAKPAEESSAKPLFGRARSKSRDRGGKAAARSKSSERAKSPTKLHISDPFNPTMTPNAHHADAKAMPMLRSKPTHAKTTATALPSKLPRATSAMNFSSLFKASTYRNKKVVNKVKDAISDRLHLIDEGEQKHAAPDDNVLDSRNESHGCHTPDRQHPPFLREDRAQRAIDSSPKLQQFFGTAGSPGTPRKHSPLADPKISPSAARRRSMYAISVLEEDALYTDDDDDDQVLPGLAKLQVTGQGTGLGIVGAKDQGIVAPWTQGSDVPESSMNFSVTDLSSAAGILSHEARGQHTRSFAMPTNQATAESMRRNKPLATPLPKHIQELAKQEPPGRFNPFVSGLLQHGDVMALVDAPVENTNDDEPEPTPESIQTPEAVREQPTSKKQDHETPLSQRKPELATSQIPRIHIKRASSASKRSSSDAELWVSPPASKKKGRLSDPTLMSVRGLPEEDIQDMEIGNRMFHALDEEFGTPAPPDSTPEPVSSMQELASAASSFNAPTTSSSSTERLSLRYFLSYTSPSRPNSFPSSRPESGASLYPEAADGSFQYAGATRLQTATATTNTSPDSPPRRPLRPSRSPPVKPRRGYVAQSSQLTGAWPSGTPYYPSTNFSKPWVGRRQSNAATTSSSFDFGLSPTTSPQTSPELGTASPRLTAAQKQKGRRQYATGAEIGSRTNLASRVDNRGTSNHKTSPRSVSEGATVLGAPKSPKSPKSPKEEKDRRRKGTFYMGEPRLEVGDEDEMGGWREERVGKAL